MNRYVENYAILNCNCLLVRMIILALEWIAMRAKNASLTLGPVSRKPRNFNGRISGHIIFYVSSKRRGLEARNFAVILIFIPFTIYEKTSFNEWLLGPEKFSELSSNGPVVYIGSTSVIKLASDL